MVRQGKGKLYYILYNDITNQYSLGYHKYRLPKDPLFSNMEEIVSYFRLLVLTGKLSRKRKMTIISNAPKGDFEALRGGLEEGLRNTKFINKKF
jgi:hypothetical protein